MMRRGRARPGPRLAAAGLALLVLWAPPVRADDRAAAEHYKAAAAHLEAGEWDAAIGRLRSALAENPRSGRNRISGMFFEEYYPYYHLGVAYLGKGQPQEAIGHFDREEAEGKIQTSRQNAGLWPRLQSLREQARQMLAREPEPAPPPAPVPAPQQPSADLVRAREEAQAALEALKAFQARARSRLSPAQDQRLTAGRQALEQALDDGSQQGLQTAAAGSRQILSYLEQELQQADALEVARREGAATRDRLQEFARTEGSGLTGAQAQEISSWVEALDAALQRREVDRIQRTRTTAEAGLIRLRATLSTPIAAGAETAQALQDSELLRGERRGFLSARGESDLAGLEADLREALASRDAGAVARLTQDLQRRTAEARGQVEQAADAVRAAYASASRGRPDETIASLEEALETAPDCPVLRLVLARFYFQEETGRTDTGEAPAPRARQETVRALQLQPDLTVPERFFPPRFVALVQEIRQEP